jgi:Family of unknown function (DUF6152)
MPGLPHTDRFSVLQSSYHSRFRRQEKLSINNLVFKEIDVAKATLYGSADSRIRVVTSGLLIDVKYVKRSSLVVCSALSGARRPKSSPSAKVSRERFVSEQEPKFLRDRTNPSNVSNVTSRGDTGHRFSRVFLADSLRYSRRCSLESKRLILLAAALLVIAAVASAHHGTANYDTTKSVSVTGIITDFEFVNPHVEVFMDVEDAKGKVVAWKGELTSPNRLSRSGWHKDTLKPRDTVTIAGFPAKSGAPEIWIQKVVLANGKELETGGGN